MQPAVLPVRTGQSAAPAEQGAFAAEFRQDIRGELVYPRPVSQLSARGLQAVPGPRSCVDGAEDKARHRAEGGTLLCEGRLGVQIQSVAEVGRGTHSSQCNQRV